MARRKVAEGTVLVTGASSGIGRALAIELAQRKAKLLLTARRSDRLKELADQLGDKTEVHFVAGDITDPELRRELLRVCDQKFGQLDVLVNNAGVGSIGPFATGTEQRLRRIMEVNFFAPSELTRAALSLLRSSPSPMVVNVGSVLGHWAAPHKSEYCASKFALHGLTDALNSELRPQGIDFLLITPSTTETEFFDHLLETTDGTIENTWKMSAQKVARKTVRAIERGRREVIFSIGGRAMIYLDRVLPWMTTKIMSLVKPPMTE